MIIVEYMKSWMHQVASGSSIPDKLTAVAYCDGDISQINVIKNSIDLFVDNKVIANKQHASWSGVEQPADLARVFKLIKMLLPEHTVKNIPVERCPMKALMIDAFKNKLDDINLPSNKTKSLIDFNSTLSAIATKVCTVKNRYLEQCTLSMFSLLKCDELDAFIIACQDTDKPEFSAKSKIPKKETIREAKQGERNKI
jgi:hypothetical protein